MHEDLISFFVENVIIDNQPVNENKISNCKLDYFLSLFKKIPDSLFKYYSNITEEENKNYSQTAIFENTVYLNEPKNFNDPYDCNLVSDIIEFKRSRINFYLKYLGYDLDRKDIDIDIAIDVLSNKIYENFNRKGIIFSLSDSLKEDVRLRLELFEVKFKKYLDEYRDWRKAIHKTIEDEIQKFVICCFTKTNNNLLMWAHYANNHKGFCVEYDLSNKDILKESEYIIFPVIYSLNRKDTFDNFKLYCEELSGEVCWNLYRDGILRKSYHWVYENEFRLIMNSKNSKSIKFYPIKAIYFGCNMIEEDKKNIYEKLKDKNIKFYQANISKDKYKIEFDNYNN